MAVNMSNDKLRPETIAAHALRALDPATGAVVPPIYLSTTYARDKNYQPLLKENYVRAGNPTLWQAEETIAALERGAASLLFCRDSLAPRGKESRLWRRRTCKYGGRKWCWRRAGPCRSLDRWEDRRPVA